MKRYLTVLSFCICVLIVLGSVSGSGVVISPDGKIIDVKYDFVPSHFKNKVNFENTGIYGEGYYTQITITGTDIKNRDINETFTYFNKYRPYTNFMDFKSATITGSDTNGIYYNSSMYLKSRYQINTESNCWLNNTKIFSMTGNITLYDKNKQILINNAVTTTKIYDNGIYYGKMISKTQFYYKKYGRTYHIYKEISNHKTYYTSGDSRSSIIKTYRYRNFKGTQNGMKTTGISKGNQRINNKSIKYTGTIRISTHYDKNDTMHEKYSYGNYHETIKSKAKNMKKELPLETLIYT